MLDQQGFDRWADGYDRSVGLSDGEDSYPFAGYGEVLARIFRRVTEKENPAVLDIGFGTGTLTARLYESGCAVWGQDFSERMIEAASRKMPEAKLFHGDFSKGLAEPLRAERYDFIIATYSLHHLTDGRKATFLRELLPLLKPGGAVLIGDVAFETREALEACRRETADWDDDEIYFVFDEMKERFPSMTFERVSFCAGILSLGEEDAQAREKMPC